MLYTTFTINGKELKLRITSRNCVALEKKLGRNPLSIFSNIENGILPTITDTVAVLHASLQALEHGWTEDKVYDLWDEYVDEGHSIMDFIPTMLEVFKVSGIISDAAEGEDSEKNV